MSQSRLPRLNFINYLQLDLMWVIQCEDYGRLIRIQ